MGIRQGPNKNKVASPKEIQATSKFTDYMFGLHQNMFLILSIFATGRC